MTADQIIAAYEAAPLADKIRVEAVVSGAPGRRARYQRQLARVRLVAAVIWALDLPTRGRGAWRKIVFEAALRDPLAMLTRRPKLSISEVPLDFLKRHTIPPKTMQSDWKRLTQVACDASLAGNILKFPGNQAHSHPAEQVDVGELLQGRSER